MRISADIRDSGFRTLMSWGKRRFGTKVFLDGVELKGCCITADEELGEVRVHVLDADGNGIIDGDEWRSEWRRGKFEVVMPKVEAA